MTLGATKFLSHSLWSLFWPFIAPHSPAISSHPSGPTRAEAAGFPTSLLIAASAPVLLHLRPLATAPNRLWPARAEQQLRSSPLRSRLS